MIKNYVLVDFKCAFKIFSFLISILIMMYFFAYTQYNCDVANSFIFGGVTSIFSSGLFLIVFFFGNNKSPRFIIRFFYLAGVLKIISLILICSFLFFYVGISSPIGYFISLFFIQIMFWVGLLFFFKGI